MSIKLKVNTYKISKIAETIKKASMVKLPLLLRFKIIFTLITILGAREAGQDGRLHFPRPFSMG